MTRIVPFVLTLVFPFATLAAQEKQMTQSTKDALNYGTFNPNPNTAFFYGIPQEPGSVQGDAYLDTAWQVARVWFFPGAVRRYNPNAVDSVSGFRIRIDLLNQLVEFRLDDTIKGIDFNAIRGILYADGSGEKALLNTRLYGVDPKEEPGFFEMLAQGEASLFRYTRLLVKDPTYNAALDVGSKDVKLFKRQEYFIRMGSRRPEKVRLGRKPLLEYLGRHETRLDVYARENRLDWGKAQDAAKLVGYYNDLSRE